jgi:3-hydroxyacyl-[acyl-carrier-protein] dehydratase
MEYDKEAIKNIIPHREPMLLVDRIETVEGETDSLMGYYTVRGDEYFVQGHFPGNPVVPGVILCEMMAQACCPVLSAGSGTTPLFASLNNVKFKNIVKPGDTVRSYVTLTRKNGPFYFASGRAYVGDKLCVSAELSFVVVKNDEIGAK